jgi:hypothetical protein
MNLFNKKKLSILSLILLMVVFWLMVIFKLGVLSATFVPKSGFFPLTFNWWNSTSVSTHYFMGIHKLKNINNNEVYNSFSYQVLLFNYFLLSIFNIFRSVSFEVSQNFIVYIYVFLFMSIVFYLNKSEIIKILYKINIFKVFWLFLLVGILVTNALPWVSFLRFNADNMFFITSILFCIQAFYSNSENIIRKDKIYFILGIILGSISIVNIIPWILCYVVSEKKLNLRKKLKINILIVFIYSLITFCLPIIIQKYAGFRSVSSSFLFRSGLDGSSKYLSSSFAPILKPISEQHFGNSIFIFVCIFILNRLSKEKRKERYNQMYISLIPFLFTLILFPQSLIIHMYLYEFLIVIPLIFNLVLTILSFDLNLISPKRYLFISLLISFVIMGQLLDISKAFANW